MKISNHLAGLPTWRLIVLVEDLERQLGRDAESTRLAARALRDRLREEDDIGLRLVIEEEGADVH